MSHGRRWRPALIRWLLVLCSCLSITSGQACFESIQAIVDVENSISDYSQLRTYVLCPSKIYEIGTLDNNYELQGYNVHPPLPIRPNMHIKCGDTGSRDNLCWIATGDVHVDATNVRGITETTVENVVIEGMVFLGAHRYSMWATKPGDITFRDCEWRVRQGYNLLESHRNMQKLPTHLISPVGTHTCRCPDFARLL